LSSAFSGLFLTLGALLHCNRTTGKYFDRNLVIDRGADLFTDTATDTFLLIHKRIWILKPNHRKRFSRTLGKTKAAALVCRAHRLVDDRQTHPDFGSLPQRNQRLGGACRHTRKVITEKTWGFIGEEDWIAVGWVFFDAAIRTRRQAITAAGTALQEQRLLHGPGGLSQSVLNFSGAPSGVFSMSFCCS